MDKDPVCTLASPHYAEVPWRSGQRDSAPWAYASAFGPRQTLPFSAPEPPLECQSRAVSPRWLGV